MTEFTTEQLELVASELNTLLSGEVQDLPEDEQIIPAKGERDEILRLIHEAVDVLMPSDKLTDDLCEIVEKTTLGDAVFEIKREDFTGEISIRELFVKRTGIDLEMPEKEEPEPEPKPEPELEPEEVQEEETAEPEPEPEPEKLMSKEVLIPEKVESLQGGAAVEEVLMPEKKKTLADLDINTLVKKLREEGVQVKRKSKKWERGKSPYSIALELACMHESFLQIRQAWSWIRPPPRAYAQRTA
jgi:hypothetical protein